VNITGQLPEGECGGKASSKPVSSRTKGCMIYVKRNPEGKVVTLSERGDDVFAECLEMDHPDVQEFLLSARIALSSSDSETIRVIEDLVDVLIRNKTIMLTDLPVAAQEKLLARQRMRSELGVLGNLMVGEEDIL
jgi:hypothetical protein